MKAEELVLAMYSQQVARSQHYETLRASLANIVLAVAAALVGIAGFDGIIDRFDAVFGVILVLLAAFGSTAAKLHSRRSDRHGKRAEAYRNALNIMLPDAMLNEIRNRVKGPPTHLDTVWASLNAGIGLVGVALIVLALA